jgi:hypothetical protein
MIAKKQYRLITSPSPELCAAAYALASTLAFGEFARSSPITFVDSSI